MLFIYLFGLRQQQRCADGHKEKADTKKPGGGMRMWQRLLRRRMQSLKSIREGGRPQSIQDSKEKLTAIDLGSPGGQEK